MADKSGGDAFSYSSVKVIEWKITVANSGGSPPSVEMAYDLLPRTLRSYSCSRKRGVERARRKPSIVLFCEMKVMAETLPHPPEEINVL